MYFNNEIDLNSNSDHTSTIPTATTTSTAAATTATTATTTTSTTPTTGSCASSTDSGVIIIDNKTAFQKKNTNNNSNKNFNNKYNNIINNNNNYNNNETKIKIDNVNEEIKNFSAKIYTTDHDGEGDEKLNINKSNINGNNDNNNTRGDKKHSSVTTSNINLENNINFVKSQTAAAAAAAQDNDADSKHSCYNEYNHSPTQHHSVPYRSGQIPPKWKNMTNSTTINSRSSPTTSIRSTTISIVSIDENAIDSSVVDSDSDYEAGAEGIHSNYIIKKLGQQTTYPAGSTDVPTINKGLAVISQKINPGSTLPLGGNILNGDLMPPATTVGNAVTPTTPQIGSIALSNSTDVTFGDKHFYEGPVTIQQFLIDSRDKQKSTDENGQDNPAYEQDGTIKTSQNNATNKANSSHLLDGRYKFVSKRKAIIFTGSILAVTILIGVLIALAIEFTKSHDTSKRLGDGDDSRKNIPINSTIVSDDDNAGDRINRGGWMARPPSGTLDKLKLPVHRVIISHTASDSCVDNIGSGKILRIVARDSWLAQPPTKPLVPLDLPVHRVIVMPTRTDVCTTQAACTYRVRFLQNFNIESTNHDDIIYNFLIGGDGNVYEGRGWDFKGAHLKGFNDDSISFAYVGTFRKQNPDVKQMNVTKLLLDEGLRLGKLAEDYKIYGANILDPTWTATSADALYESFKGWPHWAEK